MRKIPPVNAVRAFEAASRHMQFQGAAEELGITPSALSYQIRQLEEFLGIKLFRRLNRAVELTKEGQIISPRIIEAFEKMEQSFALISPDMDDNTLTISTGPAFSAKWLAPRLHSYLEENPDIDFRLSANLKLTDFDRDDVDAAIRFGPGNYPDLYVEPLFEEITTPLISPLLFEQLGSRADAGLFDKVKLIHDKSVKFLGSGLWQNWLAAMDYTNLDPESGTHFNHADHCIEAAVDGGGIVMGRLNFAFRDLKAGRLIAPFKQVMSAKGGFYFCCPHAALQQTKVLNFLAWLRDEAAEQTEAIEKFMQDRVLIDGK